MFGWPIPNGGLRNSVFLGIFLKVLRVYLSITNHLQQLKSNGLVLAHLRVSYIPPTGWLNRLFSELRRRPYLPLLTGSEVSE